MARLSVVALVFGLATTYAAPGHVGGRGAVDGAGVLDGDDVGFPSNSGLDSLNSSGSGLILNSQGSDSPHHRVARWSSFWSTSSASASSTSIRNGVRSSSSSSATASFSSNGSRTRSSAKVNTRSFGPGARARANASASRRGTRARVSARTG